MTYRFVFLNSITSACLSLFPCDDNCTTNRPDIKLEDMQCRDDFCRATFADKNGEQPPIHELFGKPPFLNEGFTVEESDGRVSVYFTRPGVSLKDAGRFS